MTDAGLVNLPVTQSTIKLLKDAGFEVGVFADVKPNPISANVNAGVDVLPAGSHPDTRSVRGSNLCRIAIHRLSGDRLIVLSVIDNLVKGAAGQAIQNLNLALGFEETARRIEADGRVLPDNIHRMLWAQAKGFYRPAG